jgi:hypothetical protein
LNLEYFSEWIRRQGHHIIKTNSSYWYDVGPKVYQAFPYHELITPTNDEILDFFRQSKAIAIRFSTPLNQPEGQLSYHVVYDQTNYEFAGLPKKARHDVTRGLQYASYEPIPLLRLAKEGWSLREETLTRQGRQNAESRSFWEELCLSADGLPCFEAWGALHEGALVATLLACKIDDTVGIFYQQSLTEHLKFGINNALTYTFTREVLNRSGTKCIFYGLHSLDAPASVDDYKFRMRYSPKPVRQRVVFNPLIAPLIQPISHSLLKIIGKILVTNSQIAKAEGMVRFYLQGKRSLFDQEWPDILREQKETILALAR